MRVFGRLRRFYWPWVWLGVGAVTAMALQTVFGLYRPQLFRELIDHVVMEGDVGRLPWLTAALMAVALARGAVHFTRQTVGHRFGQNATFALRQALYDKLQHQDFRYFDNARTGDLMSRLTADVEAFRQFLSFGLVNLADVAFMVGFSLIVMLTLSAKLTLVSLAAMPLLLVVVLRYEKVLHPSFLAIRESLGGLAATVQESITGIRTVKSFAREPHAIDQFQRKNTDYLQTFLRASNLWAEFFPLIELLSQLSVLLLLWYGGRMVIAGELSLGTLVAFFSLIWYLIWPVRELGYHINTWIQSVAAGERLLELLDAPIAIADPAEPAALESCRGHVRFEDVSFGYDPEQPVLHDISLEAPPGKIIALIGATGSGKSSLVNLIPRFYDVTAGRVTLDGRDVRTLRLADLRRQVGMVMGETFLWSATIRENIAYGRRDATMADIERAARIAEAHDFVMETPGGYDTVVGERGLGLSGGQKQRIAIARALLTDPRILILDDATSSVDMETEHEIQRALQQAMQGRTTFIIAHRLSSLKHADEILVLAHGRVAEGGTHDQLLALGGAYREIYEIQFRDRQGEVLAQR